MGRSLLCLGEKPVRVENERDIQELKLVAVEPRRVLKVMVGTCVYFK